MPETPSQTAPRPDEARPDAAGPAGPPLEAPRPAEARPHAAGRNQTDLTAGSPEAGACAEVPAIEPPSRQALPAEASPPEAVPSKAGPSEAGPADARPRTLYGRRRGKALREGQRRDLGALASLSPGPVTREANPERRALDLAALFGPSPVWLEIGFGAGEHLVHQAGLHPGIGLIGAEPYVNGVASLMGKIRRAGLANIRVHPGDARDLLEVLPEASVARAFLHYPDPWPKLRHHRRRFVTPEPLALLARVMRPGAELRLATDIPDYVRQAREEAPRAGLALAADTPEPWSDWLPTRYEAKALREGRAPRYLTFERR